MIDKDRIKTEADAFFEWPSKDKTYVTTTSMVIFSNVRSAYKMDQQQNDANPACGQSPSTELLERFEKWWEGQGQYCRAGGSDYEKTFAFRAWEAADLQRNVGDLAILVARLVRELRKAAPTNDLADKAMDYLKREGLCGSPLRSDANV
jgi:hypothetical protein